MYGRAPPPPPVEAGIPPIPSSRPIRSIPIPPTPSSSAPTSASASSSSFHTLVSPSTTSHLISPQNATSSQWMSSPLHKYHDHSSTTILPSTHHKPISRCVQYKRHIIIGCVTLAIILAIVIGVVIGTQSSSSSSSSSSSTTPVIDTANANNNNNNGAQGNTQTPGTTNAPTSIPTPSTTTPTPTKPVTSAPTTQVTPKPVATSPPNTGATSSPVTKAPTTADWVGAHGIAYTGGAVMFNPVTVWLVFYGSWEATNPALTIIPQFVKDLPGSPYWSIVSTYYSVHNSTVNGVLTSERKYVSSSLTYGGMTVAAPYDPFIKTTLVDSDVYYILRNAITQGKLNPSKAIDQNAVYILITSKDIKQGTQCDTTCGWHTSAGAMRYGWVGDSSTQCPTKCQPKSSIALTPNGDRPSDSMVSMVAHELIETVVGPGVDSWQNAGTVECADICAWNYLTTYTAPNGGTANLKMNGHDYLVQSIWVNKKGGYCGLST